MTGFQFLAGTGKGFFLFTTVSRSVLGPTQSLMQCILGALSPGVKQLGHEADCSYLVWRLRMHAAVPPLFMAWCFVEYSDSYILFRMHAHV